MRLTYAQIADEPPHYLKQRINDDCTSNDLLYCISKLAGDFLPFFRMVVMPNGPSILCTAGKTAQDRLAIMYSNLVDKDKQIVEYFRYADLDTEQTGITYIWGHQDWVKTPKYRTASKETALLVITEFWETHEMPTKFQWERS